MEFWKRAIVAAVVIGGTLLLERLIDHRMAKRELAPEAATRYRVVRRSISTTIVFVGVMSALLVIPQVRAIAGGILASSAVVGLVVGFAAQRTLANFIAGLLIAFTQPLRLGDEVKIGGDEGVVEEIGLTYTFIRTADNARVVIPNEKLASDTIRNWTIRSRETWAEITVQVPLTAELGPVVRALREEGDAFVSSLDGNATVVVRAPAPDPDAAESLERDLRLRVHERLRGLGVWA
jgi:small-conductance mechanosensitive channel